MFDNVKNIVSDVDSLSVVSVVVSLSPLCLFVSQNVVIMLFLFSDLTPQVATIDIVTDKHLDTGYLVEPWARQ